MQVEKSGEQQKDPRQPLVFHRLHLRHACLRGHERRWWCARRVQAGVGKGGVRGEEGEDENKEEREEEEGVVEGKKWKEVVAMIVQWRWLKGEREGGGREGGETGRRRGGYSKANAPLCSRGTEFPLQPSGTPRTSGQTRTRHPTCTAADVRARRTDKTRAGGKLNWLRGRRRGGGDRWKASRQVEEGGGAKVRDDT
eukprot:649364-Hanusia_phi.AAC.4